MKKRTKKILGSVLLSPAVVAILVYAGYNIYHTPVEFFIAIALIGSTLGGVTLLVDEE